MGPNFSLIELSYVCSFESMEKRIQVPQYIVDSSENTFLLSPHSLKLLSCF